MKLAIVVLCLLAWSVVAEAQGISNARDGRGNLIDRGSATRSYQTAPMVNSSVGQAPPQFYVIRARPRPVVIRAKG